MSEQTVSRKMLLLVVIGLVAMMGLSDLAVWQLSRAPSATTVKHQIDNELHARSVIRDRQTCALLSSVRRTQLTNEVRNALHCEASTPLQKPGVTVTIQPGMPSQHATPSRAPRPSPSRRPTSHPSRSPHPSSRPTPAPSPTRSLCLLVICL